MLKVLNTEVTRTSVERTAALHERFANPQHCKNKQALGQALRAWRQDFEELVSAAAGLEPPSPGCV